MKYLPLLFIFFSFQSFSQSKSLNKVINQIDYQNDTLLAVFNWVTDNIKYDVKKMKDLENGVSFYKKGKFKSREEYKKSQLEKVIKKKKGVCEDYTLLFHNIVRELGYQSFVVGGITKNYKGKVQKGGSHSWIAIIENGEWKLYDPTWGAGYLNEKKKFVKKYVDKWYDVDPKVMLERHFPFDPIWQLSTYPMTFMGFTKDNPSLVSDNPYDFDTMIAEFLQSNNKERSALELKRLESIDTNFKLIKKRIDYLRNIVNKSDVSNIINGCRESSTRFSEYLLEGKNKRFSEGKWTKEYALSAMLELEGNINRSIADLKGIKTKKSKNKKIISRTLSKSKKLLSHVEEEIKFLKK